MSLVNSTPWAVQEAVIPDHLGRQVVVIMVKATFELRANGSVGPAETPAPVRLGEECWDAEDPRTSLRLPSDLCTGKVGTDVVVVGSAISAKPVASMDVAVAVRDAVAPLRVHGEREFRRGIGDVVVGSPAPFVETPICYELAYGGQTEDHKLFESRNFSGTGIAHKPGDLVGRPAPRIEHPARPHRSAADRHPPVGYGAIWAYWSPRRELYGTMDQAWIESRMPIMPLDFDLRANNVAHPSLVFGKALAPGDPVSVTGMSLDGPVRFAVPVLPLAMVARFDVSGRVVVRPVLDTLLILPNERRLEVVARHAFPVGRGRDVLREVRVESVALAA